MGEIFNKMNSIFGLSFQLAKAGFKLRNEGSYLGILWYLLNPILMFLLLFLVFSDRLGVNIPSYPLYLLIGIIMFNLFSSSTTESVKIIVKDYGGLIKSINFPRESIVLGVVFRSLFSHIFELILFFIIILIFGGNLGGLIFYPIILLFLLFFIFGTCLILSSLTVYFADIENIWLFASRLIWLGTPIFYSIGGQMRLYYVNLFNPMYYFINVAREVVVYSHVPEFGFMMGAIFYSLLFLLFGLLIYNRLKVKFAEMM